MTIQGLGNTQLNQLDWSKVAPSSNQPQEAFQSGQVPATDVKAELRRLTERSQLGVLEDIRQQTHVEGPIGAKSLEEALNTGVKVSGPILGGPTSVLLVAMQDGKLQGTLQEGTQTHSIALQEDFDGIRGSLPNDAKFHLDKLGDGYFVSVNHPNGLTLTTMPSDRSWSPSRFLLTAEKGGFGLTFDETDHVFGRLEKVTGDVMISDGHARRGSLQLAEPELTSTVGQAARAKEGLMRAATELFGTATGPVPAPVEPTSIEQRGLALVDPASAPALQNALKGTSVQGLAGQTLSQALEQGITISGPLPGGTLHLVIDQGQLRASLQRGDGTSSLLDVCARDERAVTVKLPNQDQLWLYHEPRSNYWGTACEETRIARSRAGVELAYARHTCADEVYTTCELWTRDAKLVLDVDKGGKDGLTVRAKKDGVEAWNTGRLMRKSEFLEGEAYAQALPGLESAKAQALAALAGLLTSI